MAAPHARTTIRLQEALRHIAFACGGEGGARLAHKLSMATSPDSLLRLMRRSAACEDSTPRVLGVDDWALRRGQRYGTILCDLERRCPIELLPERSSEQLSQWLQKHPGVQIISRDRGDDYAKGAKDGAPQATQVADRFHLLHNLHETMVRLVDRHHAQVLKAAKAAAISVQTEVDQQTSIDHVTPQVSSSPHGKHTGADQVKQSNRTRRKQRYDRVIELHRQGFSQRDIAKQMGMHRGTVRRFVHAGCFPERAARRFHRRTDPLVDQLRRRWAAGCHNAAQLTRELRATGVEVSYYMVRRRVAQWRHTPDAGNTTEPSRRIRRPSSTRVAWILMKRDDDLLPDEQMLREKLLASCQVLRDATILTEEFADLIRHHRARDLDSWIELASTDDVCPEMRRFARGLTTDLAAVRAALTLRWSNGQVEGQINRLKLVKRQMYGRANFDLLRSRFLHAS